MKLFHLFAGMAVNYSGLIFKFLNKLKRLSQRVILGHNLDKQIFPVKAGHKFMAAVHLQAGFDVRANSGGGRGRQGYTGGLGKIGPGFNQLAVFRPKIMTPL